MGEIAEGGVFVIVYLLVGYADGLAAVFGKHFAVVQGIVGTFQVAIVLGGEDEGKEVLVFLVRLWDIAVNRFSCSSGVGQRQFVSIEVTPFFVTCATPPSNFVTASYSAGTTILPLVSI